VVLEAMETFSSINLIPYASHGTKIYSLSELPGIVVDATFPEIYFHYLPQLKNFHFVENKLSISSSACHISWQAVGVFQIRNGTEVLISLLPETSETHSLSYLLGMVMAILMHQRGNLVLHASSLEIAGRAVGIGAHSGTGKSTFAAYLATRGHGYLTDDMIPLKTEDGAGPQVYPGFPLAKLHPETAAALNIPAERITPISAEMDKKFVSFPPREDPMQAYPLHALYILNEGPEVSLTRMPVQQAVMELVTHSFSRIFAQNEFQTTGDKARLQKTLQQCAWLAGKIPVYRLTRPRDFALLPQLAALIEANVREGG